MQPQYSSYYQVATPVLEYVGVGRRLLAIIIDGLILLIVNSIIGVVFHSDGAITVAGEITCKVIGVGLVVPTTAGIVCITARQWGACLCCPHPSKCIVVPIKNPVAIDQWWALPVCPDVHQATLWIDRSCNTRD